MRVDWTRECMTKTRYYFDCFHREQQSVSVALMQRDVCRVVPVFVLKLCSSRSCHCYSDPCRTKYCAKIPSECSYVQHLILLHFLLLKSVKRFFVWLMNQLRLLSRIFYEFRLLSAFDVLRNLRTVHSFRYSEANTTCATQHKWFVSVVCFQLKGINKLFIFRLFVVVLVFLWFMVQCMYVCMYVYCHL